MSARDQRTESRRILREIHKHEAELAQLRRQLARVREALATTTPGDR